MPRRRHPPQRFGGVEAEVNLTPLIDVVFVVLIMFIVIAPILELDRVALAAGRPDHPEAVTVRESSALLLHVKEDNSIWLNRRQIDPSYLEAALRAEREHNPGAIPQLYHDRTAQFGTYQSVKNATEAAGFEELDLILEPQ